MLCPICLTFSVNRDATTQVKGTQYCAQHGVQALNLPDRAQGRFLERFFAPPTPET